ncbi:MAG TPA: DNRLRE domain-containing protein, partial [Anaerolineae bacterium]
MASGQPTQNWAAHPSLWVGYDQAGGYQVERSLLRFDVSAIPAGSQINSAAIRLFLGGTTTNDAPMAVAVHRVRSDWPETITWNGSLGLTVDPLPAATT